MFKSNSLTTQSQTIIEVFSHKTCWMILTLILCLFSLTLHGHPEDEFCQDIEMDPILCAQLAALDRPATGSGPYQLIDIQLDRSPSDTGLLYTKLGVEHIIPMGLDHLAFVLALVLSARTFKKLAIQITLFTLAHSFTLILSVMGLLVLEGSWIEVAIALSIAFVAFENIFIKSIRPWRYLVVFAFGLLHGLGFAGALSDLGIPDEHFFSALIGFNIGVEIGQLGFAFIIFLLLCRFINRSWYRHRVIIPGSLFVGALGVFWMMERL